MTAERQKIIITSALLYANGVLHFGHLAGAYLAADVYARFERLMGNDVLFISGSDEYGVPITLSAELAGRTPQEQVDIYHAINKGLFEQLDFSFDHYSRTTWPGHVEPVEQYFRELVKNDYIDIRETEQLYCEADKRFLADRYVLGTCPRCHFEEARGDECPKCAASYEATDLIKPRSRLSGAPLEKRSTTHWFLRLDELAPALREWLSTHRWKESVMNFLQHYVDNLQPRAITRDSSWGVPVPLKEAEDKVFYVWFDAPIGYLSASMEWAQLQGKPEKWRDYWCDPQTRLVHFIGKDNIFFHGILFPAMTLGQDQPYKLVDDLPANEFLKLEGRQFSKSDNWMIDLPDFLQRYTVDQLRYTLAANAPESADADFTWHDFQMRCNSELVGKYGNLINRSLVFAQRYCSAQIPPLTDSSLAADFFQQIDQLVGQIQQSYREYRLRRACQLIMELASLGNTFFNDQKPWAFAKQADGQAVVESTIHACLVCLKALAIVSFPVIPGTAEKVWQLLACPGQLAQAGWEQGLQLALVTGAALPQPKILFEKISDEQIAAEEAALKSS